MSRGSDWLASRRPRPPAPLAEALARLEMGEPRPAELGTAARERLDAVRARLGRVRESAFLLLEADALLTYACESALESTDPEAELERVLALAGG